MHEGARDRDALYQSARQCAYLPVGVFLEPQTREQIGTRLCVVEQPPEAEVLVHGELTVELRVMADPADRPTAAIDIRAPVLWLDQTGQNLEERRLAGAVRSEHREGLARIDREGDVVKGSNGAERVA